MKKILTIAIFLISLQANNIQADYWKARNWFDRYRQDITDNDENIKLLTEYAFCRVEEIDYWLKTQIKDIPHIEYEIANEGYKRALAKKKDLEYRSDFALTRFLFARTCKNSLKALREEATKIADLKFTSEILSSIFIQYKVGKRAEAKIAKRNFYFECYKLLKNGSYDNYYR